MAGFDNYGLPALNQRCYLIDGSDLINVQVTGVVQGVNFRAWTKKQANSYGISGFIRNAEEGHVEGLAFGSAQAMDNFKTLLHQGPRHAEVSAVVINDEKSIETAEEIDWKLKKFEVRR